MVAQDRIMQDHEALVVQEALLVRLEMLVEQVITDQAQV